MVFFKDLFRIITVRKLLLISSFISIGINLIVKYLDIDSLFSTIDGDIFLYFVLIMAVFLNILCFLYFNLHKNKSVILVDVYFIILVTTLIISNVQLILFHNNYDHLVIWFFRVFLLFIAIIVLIRIIISSKRLSYGSLVDFKDLYEGKLDYTKKRNKIIIEEREVEYDLLEKNVISDQLFETIQDLEPQSKLIIALEGEWGSGKSTILNLVKKNIINDKKTRSNCIIIDDFDPWHYNDERSMLKSMLEKIIDSVRIGLLNRNTRTIIRKFVNSVFERKGFTLFDDYPLLDDTFGFDNLIEIVNSYLKNNGKKIIFIIDNIDRTQQEHVFFIYKSIASLIKIKHIVYILAYDPKIVLSAFENMKLDKKYLEKIIQIKYTVSMDTRVFNNVKSRALINFYKYNGIDLTQTYDQTEILDMVENFSNLREYKLFINKLSNTINTNKSYLNPNDLAKITIIQSQSPDLFNLIKSNYQYFITEGTMDDPNIYTKRIVRESFESEAKAFFKESTKLDYWKKHSKILEDLFPIIKNYNKNYSDIYSHSLYDNAKSNLERRVSNAKYFPLYFTDTLNEFIAIDRLVDDFLENLQSDNWSHNRMDFAKSILSLDFYGQILFFENLYLHIDHKSIYNLEKLMKFILCLFYYLDDTHQGFSFRFNARTRAIVLISKMLFKLDKKNFEMILDSIVKDPKNLYLVRNLRYWLSPESNKIGNYDEGKYAEIDSKYIMMLNEICANRVDLYNPNYYSRYNARCLEWNMTDTQAIIEYFNQIITKNNIFKYLYDYMQITTGSKGYGYTIELKKVHSMISKEKIEDLLTVDTYNEDDLFVKEVYRKSFGLSSDGFESAILRSDSIELYKEQVLNLDCLK